MKNSVLNLTVKVLLALLILGAFAYFFVLPNFLVPVQYSPDSRVRADHRSLATALEAYWADHRAYPLEAPLRDRSAHPKKLKHVGGWELDTYELGINSKVHGLSTPVSYISGDFTDPFTRSRLKRGYDAKPTGSISPYAYHTDGTGWILISPGRDGHYDTDPNTDYDSSVPQPSVRLLEKTYDPTNGAASRGDIYRVWESRTSAN